MPSPPHLPQNGKTKNLPKNVPFTPGHTLWEQQEEAQADKDSEISQAIQWSEGIFLLAQLKVSSLPCFCGSHYNVEMQSNTSAS